MPHSPFDSEIAQRLAEQATAAPLLAAAKSFMHAATPAKYSYNFKWLGRPIIQYPQDMVAMQELIWSVKPDLIVETGIAHGGSLVFSATMLALLDYCDAVESGSVIEPRRASRKVLGLDLDIRAHNRAAIEAHPLSNRITMLQGSSIAPEIVAQVHAFAKPFKRILLCLDSNHTHDHVLAELNAYAPFVTPGSYCVVFDTIIEDLPADMYPDRPWGPGNSPKSALREFLKMHPEFEIDKSIDHKLLISVSPDGYLRRKY
jgi:cephalosporin hydroxylase